MEDYDRCHRIKSEIAKKKEVVEFQREELFKNFSDYPEACGYKIRELPDLAIGGSNAGRTFRDAPPGLGNHQKQCAEQYSRCSNKQKCSLPGSNGAQAGYDNFTGAGYKRNYGCADDKSQSCTDR